MSFVNKKEWKKNYVMFSLFYKYNYYSDGKTRIYNIKFLFLQLHFAYSANWKQSHEIVFNFRWPKNIRIIEWSLWLLLRNFHSMARTIASRIPGEYLGALRGNWHCDVQIDQNKLHKIFHLRSHSEWSCPENYCKHLMQSESVATPWGRWAKTMRIEPLICFPTGWAAFLFWVMPGICDKLCELRTENTKETELSFPELGCQGGWVVFFGGWRRQGKGKYFSNQITDTTSMLLK